MMQLPPDLFAKLGKHKSGQHNHQEQEEQEATSLAAQSTGSWTESPSVASSSSISASNSLISLESVLASFAAPQQLVPSELERNSRSVEDPLFKVPSLPAHRVASSTKAPNMPDNALSVAHPSNANATQKKEVPAFLQKLFKMVDDPTTDSLIRWNEAGDSFLVMRHEDFAKELLPRYYKHKHFSSFVRQLNMYGFHKIPHIEDNTLSKGEIWEFSNPNFNRDQPDLLCLVTRKKSGEATEKDAIDFMSVVKEIQAIKRHQVTISQDLKRIQADNQALWQEQADTRARHSKHQETIEKILAFLGHIYGSQGQEDKSIRPKKRKLLLESDSSEQVATLASVAHRLQDEKAQETFQDMFKSARSSPRPSPIPTRPSQRNSPQAHYAHVSAQTQQDKRPSVNRFESEPDEPEQRFTLPNRPAQTHATTGQHASGRDRSRSRASPAEILEAAPPPPTLPRTAMALTQTRPPSIDEFQQAPLPDALALTPSIENRLGYNKQRAMELEQDILQQDENLEALANLLGMDAASLDMTQLDPSLLDSMMTEDGQAYNPAEFSQFLEEFPGTAELQDGTTTAGGGQTPGSAYNWLDTTGTAGNAQYAGGAQPQTASSSRQTPSLGVNGGSGEFTTGTRSEGSTPRLESLTSTPPSVASKDEELIEEIDMDTARGKRRGS